MHIDVRAEKDSVQKAETEAASLSMCLLASYRRLVQVEMCQEPICHACTNSPPSLTSPLRMFRERRDRLIDLAA
jgi:hypothetical protein